MMIRTPLLVAGISALALAGCDPAATGVPRSTAGAVTGALVGAAIGGNSSGSGSRLARGAVGAVIGGVVGGAIGATLDRQAADLQGSVSNQTKVVNTGNALVVTMPQDILFALNSATLRPDLQRDLAAVSANLLNYPNSKIEISGHTDNTGTSALNRDLSQQRASSVANVLRSNGVPSSRIIAFGRGEDVPIASNLTPEGRAANRRVEIVIRPTN